MTFHSEAWSLTAACSGQRLHEVFTVLKGKLVGYYGYYGMIGNWANLRCSYNGALRILRKWLPRFSERGRM